MFSEKAKSRAVKRAAKKRRELEECSRDPKQTKISFGSSLVISRYEGKFHCT